VVLGPSLPAASLCTLPAHPAEPAWQFRVAEALDQLEAPATVGDTVAPDPGEPPVPGPVGGVEGCEPELPVEPPLPEPPELPIPPVPPVVVLPDPAGLAWLVPLPVGPVVWEVVVAFGVDGACTSGLIAEASGPVEAPELVTA
jgi:hypothetical protein